LTLLAITGIRQGRVGPRDGSRPATGPRPAWVTPRQWCWP